MQHSPFVASANTDSSQSEQKKPNQSIFHGISAGVKLDTTSNNNIFGKLNSANDINTYSANKTGPSVNFEALFIICKVYIMAYRYEVQPLQYCARNKYAEMMPKAWNSLYFIQSLELIYDSIPRKDIADPLLDVARK